MPEEIESTVEMSTSSVQAIFFSSEVILKSFCKIYPGWNKA